MTKSVAVTGATGFVGSHLTRRLVGQGWSVRILARRMPTAALAPDASLDVVLGDLDDARSLRRLVRDADAVIHVAGIVKARRSADFLAANVEGTRHLLAAVADVAPAARFVHISSLAAREPRLSPYAASKSAGEDLVAAVAHRQAVTIIRPPAVYGPGDLEILPLFRAAARGICPHPGVSGMRMSMIHVEDLAKAIAGAAGTERLSELRYEVDDGRQGGYTWAEISGTLAQAFGRTVRPIPVSRFVLTMAAAVEEVRRRLSGRVRVLSLTKVPELFHPDWVAQGPILWEHLSLSPTLTLIQGLQDTLDWYCAHGHIGPNRISIQARKNIS